MLSRRSFFGALFAAPVAAVFGPSVAKEASMQGTPIPIGVGRARHAANLTHYVDMRPGEFVIPKDQAQAMAKAVAEAWKRNPSLRPNF